MWFSLSQFHHQQPALGADDADLGAFGGTRAAPRPFAVAALGAAAAVLDRLGHRQYFADQPPAALVEQRVGGGDRIVAQIFAPRVKRDDRQYGKDGELQRDTDRDDPRDDAGDDRGGAEPDEEEARRDDLGRREQDADRQPRPMRLHVRNPVGHVSGPLRGWSAHPWPVRRCRRACRSTGSPRRGTGSSWHWGWSRTGWSPRH